MAIHTAAGTAQPRADLMASYFEWDPLADGLIGDLVFPAMPVNKRKGDYGVVTREAWLSRVDTKRKPRAETSESDWDPESATFGMLEYAHKEFVPDPQREDYLDWFDLEEIAAMRTARVIGIDGEVDAADIAFSTTIFPLSGNTGMTVANAWDTANGVPTDDILVGQDKIGNRFGVLADTLVCDIYVYQKLCRNSSVRGDLTEQYGQIKPGLVPPEQLAVILGLNKIIIAGYGAVYSTAKPGQNAVTAKIWNQTRALLTRIDEGRDIQRPQLGRTFTLKSESVAVESWRENDPKGSYIRSERNMQRKASPDPVGFLFGGVTT